MIKNYVLDKNVILTLIYKINTNSDLFDPLKLMIIIYLCEDKDIPHKLIQRCRLNPDLSLKYKNRIDIEFYVNI